MSAQREGWTNYARTLFANGHEWKDHAVCRQVDPELMWPLPNALVPIERAVAVCVPCTAKRECLQEGVDIADWESVRGGLTGKQRRKCHKAGLTVDQYPVRELPRRWCVRCEKPFPANVAHPLGRTCPSCLTAEPTPELADAEVLPS